MQSLLFTVLPVLHFEEQSTFYLDGQQTGQTPKLQCPHYILAHMTLKHPLLGHNGRHLLFLH